MAIYRQIQIDFWQDELITEFTPEDKLFYLYLMTNSKTNQCGIYRINKRIMAFDIGWNVDTIDKMLARFVSYGRIKYNEAENEIYIVNWIKHNSARSPKVAARVDSELKDVKTVEFHNDVVERCIEYGYPISTVPIQVGNNSTVSIQVRNNSTVPIQVRNKNKNKNNNNNNNNNQDEMIPAVSPAPTNAHLFYQDNFGIANPTIIQTIQHWVNDLNEELVIEAMRRAAVDQKGFRYAEGIMKNWDKKNIRSMDQVKAEDVAFTNRKQPTGNLGRTIKVEKLPDWVDKPQSTEEKLIDEETQQAFMDRLKRFREG